MLSDLGHDYNSDFVIDPSEVDIRLSKIIKYTRLLDRTGSQIGFLVISAN